MNIFSSVLVILGLSLSFVSCESNKDFKICEKGKDCEQASSNEAPTISNVADQTINEGASTSALALTIDDVDSILTCASLSMGSSNATLIGDGDVVFSGTAPDCTATLSPNANESGSATITLTVTDGSLTDTDIFVLNVIPEGYVLVPANAGEMGLPVFFVMKYEAKAMLNDESATDATGTGAATATHKPVSTADNQPWININANDSASECESLGSGYHLISNPEWMAIARDIENQDANWTGGTIGSGCMFRGNSGETTSGDGTGASDSCGYNAATDPEQGSGRDLRAKHTLSSGQEVFDISGNLWEWTDWDKDTLGFQSGPTNCPWAWAELPAVSCVGLSGVDYNTDNATYTSTEGVGRVAGGTGGATMRGGFWGDLTDAGAYAIRLDFGPTVTDSVTGFRCVFRP